MKTVTERLIEFHCPGTFVDEVTSRAVPEELFTVEHAVALAPTILQRHNAKPYGFHLVIRTWEETEEGGKTLRSDPEVDRSGCYYLDGKVLTLDDIPDTEENSILRSNMQCNDIPAVVRTQNSWRHTAELQRGDVVLQGTKVVARGEDYYG